MPLKSSKDKSGYIHTDIFTRQTSKITGNACGDVIGFHRDRQSTVIVLSDGLGSGIKANIAANLCVSRIITLIENGATTREAFSGLTKTMNRAWGKAEPFAVFTIARILNNGQTTVLSYEMPPPVRITGQFADVLEHRSYTMEKAVVGEAVFTMNKSEGLLLVSDGITQAGIGKGLSYGWQIEGVVKFITHKLITQRIAGQVVTDLVHDQARVLWRDAKGDDCSVVYAKNRNGVIINLLSGPPANKKYDLAMVNHFLSNKGFKIVCGGSTAKMVAREKSSVLGIEDSGSYLTPPQYTIEGIDLVTEGVVTLNQVYNVIDENVDEIDSDSPVFEFVRMLRLADRINIWLGNADNVSSENIAFRQQGIIPRKKIINLIAQKLRADGKLIVIHGEDEFEPAI